MRSGEDRDAHDVDILVHGGGHNLLGRETDALVDHLEAGIPSADGNLLRPVRVSVKTWLGDEEAQTRSELISRGLHGLAHGAQLIGGRTGSD